MKISIVTPVFNEQDNIYELVSRVHAVFVNLKDFDYEHIIIDNDSNDRSFEICESLLSEFPNLVLIRNERNFGFSRSSFYGLMQATGDCAIFLMADLQDPPELINQMIEEWQKGNAIITCIKTQSKESKVKYMMRSLYYKIMSIFTSGQHIEHFTGFGLYDRKFLDVMKFCNDSIPYLRGIVYEYGFRIKRIEYCQQQRKFGNSKFNFWNLFDLAMLGFVSSSRAPLRIMVVCGFLASLIFLCIGVFYLVLKLLFWDVFQAGLAGLVVSVFFIGSIQLFMIGLIGEYIGATFHQTRNRPMVIERYRKISNFKYKKND